MTRAGFIVRQRPRPPELVKISRTRDLTGERFVMTPALLQQFRTYYATGKPPSVAPKRWAAGTSPAKLALRAPVLLD